jgi:hypothetical protein
MQFSASWVVTLGVGKSLEHKHPLLSQEEGMQVYNGCEISNWLKKHVPR